MTSRIEETTCPYIGSPAIQALALMQRVEKSTLSGSRSESAFATYAATSAPPETIPWTNASSDHRGGASRRYERARRFKRELRVSA